MRLVGTWLLCVLCAAMAQAEVPDVMSVIAGRFDRPEPAFFEARHKRLKSELDKLPETPQSPEQQRRILEALPLFDQAANALQRAGRFEDAIYLLDQKLRRIEQTRPVHGIAARSEEARMLLTKADCLLARHAALANRADLDQARKLLKQALELDRFNVAAQYALDEVNWLLEPPVWQADVFPFPNLLGIDEEMLSLPRSPETPAQIRHAGALDYLLQRIVHGGGWHNVDVFHALSLVLWIQGSDEEAITAWLRVNELLATGAATAVRDAPTGLARRMAAHLGEIPDARRQQDLYKEVRHHADEWHSARHAYAAAQLAQSRHPDTHPDFWNAFSKPEPPAAISAPETKPEPPMSTVFIFGGAAALAFLLVVLAAFTYYVSRRHPKAPTVDEV